MLRLINKIEIFLSKMGSPYTNVYGIARSLIALSTLMTLIFSDIHSLFKPVLGISEYPYCTTGINSLSVFCLFPEYSIIFPKIISILILILTLIGWRPRITGVLHWWISFSVQNSMTTLDGGDQLAAVLTFMLIPMTLCDDRKWHWMEQKKNSINRPFENGVGWAVIFVIQIQIAILYLHSSIAKLTTDEWINGTAVYYYLNDPMLGVNPFILDFISPIIESNLVVFPTWITLIIQFLLFCGLFASYHIKKILFFIAIFMHELFALMLGLVSFSTVMFAALILYLLPLNKHLKIKKRKFMDFSIRKEVKKI